MTAEIKNYNLVDEDEYVDDNGAFHYSIEMEIGPFNTKKSDVFSVEVCSPLWLIQSMLSDDVIMKKALIITKNANIDVLMRILSKKVSSFHSESWDELAKALSSILNWEYEGYVASKPSS